MVCHSVARLVVVGIGGTDLSYRILSEALWRLLLVHCCCWLGSVTAICGICWPRIPDTDARCIRSSKLERTGRSGDMRTAGVSALAVIGVADVPPYDVDRGDAIGSPPCAVGDFRSDVSISRGVLVRRAVLLAARRAGGMISVGLGDGEGCVGA